jgi:ubiquinone/menaquinone biosynthesis C-methylase UbiE
MRRTLSSLHLIRWYRDRVGLLYSWLTNVPLWHESLREMARHFPPGAAELKVLYVGFGPGNLVRQLLDFRPDLRIVGLDFSIGMLRRARLTSPPAPLRLERGEENARSLHPVEFAQADIARLPIPDNSIDAITAHSVYHILDDQAAFLQETMRVLRPGGRLILLDPARRFYSLDALRHIRRPRVVVSVLIWQAIARFYKQVTLKEMTAQLIEAGFARVLTERAMEGYAVLSRGEKPYPDPDLSTMQRIARTAAIDRATADWQIVDSAALPTMGRGRFVFLLVRQTPDKPPWAIQPGETIRWEAAMVSDTADHHRPYLLAFTSLPKAVEFMQPAVTSGVLKGVNKVARFDKAAAPQWAAGVLLNPPFERLRKSGQYAFAGAWLAVDPARAVAGEE